MLRTVKRILGVEFRTWNGFLQIFENDGALEYDGGLGVLAFDLEHRHLAERRDLQEPIRLVGEIDIDDVERLSLFLQRDDGALDEGAER